MRVKSLIKQLEKQDPESEVALNEDGDSWNGPHGILGLRVEKAKTKKGKPKVFLVLK